MKMAALQIHESWSGKEGLGGFIDDISNDAFYGFARCYVNE